MNELADTTELRTELERASETPERENVTQLLERMRPELAKLLPEQVTPERFTRTVLTELRRTPALYDCTPESLLGAMMLAAQIGLEPGPLGHVYLVPFAGDVEFVVGYRGFVELAYRSGLVKDVHAALVYDGEPFEYQFGTSPRLTHRPAAPPAEGDPIAAYAVARLRSGGAPFVVTYEQDWEHARNASPAGKKNVGPWQTDRRAMILKTALRRLARFLPQTPALAVAVERDEQPAPELNDEGGDDGDGLA